MALNQLPANVPAVCALRFCDVPAVFVWTSNGHPNGDTGAGYCAEHINQRPGMWTDSPKTYSITLSGPYAPRAGA